VNALFPCVSVNVAEVPKFAGELSFFIVKSVFQICCIKMFVGCCFYASAEVEGITYYYVQSGAGYISAYFSLSSIIMFK
jgi:hypothetical protein